MPETTAPNPTNIADRLPASVYYQIVHTLRLLLPPLPSNNLEDTTRQLETAIAKVGSFAPANAAEADLAARYVAFNAHADDCLRLAVLLVTKGQIGWVVKCRAQAGAMARQASG
jgi:hypothetical protein